MPNERTKDRRVKRTEGLLIAALTSLIHEKPYERIVVKEILARANVGRSTFYTHFRDKDELLLSAIHEILRAAAGMPALKSGGSGMILRFSLPIFEHIERLRRPNDPEVKPQGQAIVHQHLQQALVVFITGALNRVGRQPRGMPPTLLAQYVASTFVLVLNWWVTSMDPVSAAEANDLFRALVVPVLDEMLA